MKDVDITKFAKGLEKAVRDYAVRSARRLVEDEIQQLHPVYTGYSSSEWQAGNAASEEPIRPLDEAGYKQLVEKRKDTCSRVVFFNAADFKKQLENVTKSKFFIFNNAYYIETLEAERSFVAASKSAMQAILDEEIEELEDSSEE